MTNNEITKMANEAGFVTGLVANKKPFIWHLFVEDDNLFPEMKLFAKLVAKAEREACALICAQYDNDPIVFASVDIAKKIRARR